MILLAIFSLLAIFMTAGVECGKFCFCFVFFHHLKCVKESQQIRTEFGSYCLKL